MVCPRAGNVVLLTQGRCCKRWGARECKPETGGRLESQSARKTSCGGRGQCTSCSGPDYCFGRIPWYPGRRYHQIACGSAQIGCLFPCVEEHIGAACGAGNSI